MRFRDLTNLLVALGFAEIRGRGTHRRFVHSHSDPMVVQPDGAHAKPYQVRQLAALVERYSLKL